MGDCRSLMQVAKDAQLLRRRRGDNVNGIGNSQGPACGRADPLHTDILIAGDQGELLRPSRRLENAHVSDHHLWPRTGKSRLRFAVAADHRGIKITKAINLRRAKKTDIDATSL